MREAEDGEEALELVAEDPPDLVLLDIMMPGIDGIEVCRRIKSDPRTAMIPVILVTALHDWEHRMAGIDAGASDFVTKPINLDEVALRVRNGVRAKQMYDQLQEQNRALEELQNLRDNMTHMVIHDMRTPLTMVLGYLDLFDATGPRDLEPNDRNTLARVREGATRLDRMINSLLEITQLQEGRLPLHLGVCCLFELCQELVADFRIQKGGRELSLVNEGETPIQIDCDRDLVTRMLANLVGNAIKFTPEDGVVRLVLRPNGRYVEARVEDNGEGVPESFLGKIFQPFTRAPTRTEQRGNGLGLAFCKLVVEAHHGCIDVESTPGEGTVFKVRLPMRPGSR